MFVDQSIPYGEPDYLQIKIKCLGNSKLPTKRRESNLPLSPSRGG